MKIQTKRIYDPPAPTDGCRVLVDRLWPRGVRKADAALDEWCKPLAPSDELRKAFHHDPEKWDAFQRQYTKQLTDMQPQVAALVDRCGAKTLTLLYAAKDQDHNNAAVLKAFIESKIINPSNARAR